MYSFYQRYLFKGHCVSKILSMNISPIKNTGYIKRKNKSTKRVKIDNTTPLDTMYLEPQGYYCNLAPRVLKHHMELEEKQTLKN